MIVDCKLGVDIYPTVPNPLTVDVSCEVETYPNVPNPLVVETNAYTNVDVFDDEPKIFVYVLIHEHGFSVNLVKYRVVEES